jgi:Tol biopolymer transport system component
MSRDTEGLPKELASLPTLAQPIAAPTGEEVAFYYDSTGRNELHVLDVESGEINQWSDGDVPRDVTWPLKWATDCDRIFFHLDDEGNEQNDIHAISRDGAVEPVVEMEGQTTLQSVGHDGETLLFTSTRDGQRNVFRYRDGDITKLTACDRAVSGAVLSPDCEQFAYKTNETEDFDNQDVYIANIDGSNTRNLELGEVGAESSPIDWGPDGDRLLVTDNTTDLKRIGVYHLDGDEVGWFGDGEFDERAVAFLPDGDRVIGLRKHAAERSPIVYDIETGESTAFDLPEGDALFWHHGRLDGARVLVYLTTPTTRPELIAYAHL